MGRRWTLAGSTFVTAFFCVLFILAQSAWEVRASTVGISLSATVRARCFLPHARELTPIDAGHVGRSVWVRRLNCACALVRAEMPYRWTPEIFGTKGTLPNPTSGIPYRTYPVRQCVGRRVEQPLRCLECESIADSLPFLSVLTAVRARSGGMIAPLLGGSLLMVHRSFPVIASVVIFTIAGFCVLLLRDGPGERGSRGGLMH